MVLGRINRLKATRESEHGFYLSDSFGEEVLLPNAYLSNNLKLGDEIDVFLYTDSEDRLVATTEHPYVLKNEFAVLKAIDINQFGAFMDWGLPKDLLVPFSEQVGRMKKGSCYLIYLKEDTKTGRLIGSNRENRYIDSNLSELKEHDKVELLLYKMTDLGMNAIINGRYKGLIFRSDIHKPIQIGEKIQGYIKQIRADGKIDLILEPAGFKNTIDKNSSLVLEALKENNGFLNLSDNSPPTEINEKLGISKKAFKKALGNLYKLKLIRFTKNGTVLIKPTP